MKHNTHDYKPYYFIHQVIQISNHYSILIYNLKITNLWSYFMNKIHAPVFCR